MKTQLSKPARKKRDTLKVIPLFTLFTVWKPFQVPSCDANLGCLWRLTKSQANGKERNRAIKAALDCACSYHVALAVWRKTKSAALRSSRGVGRGCGVGRGLGVTLGVGVADGLGVCVGVAVGLGVGVGVGVGVPVEMSSQVSLKFALLT
jgi:hypothetical protein